MSLEQRQEIVDELILRYQQIINMLDNTPNQPSNFRAKNRVEINYNWWGTYNTNRPIKFETSTLMSNLSDYSDGYILVKGIIRILNKE